MKTKCLAIGIILLFVGVIISPGATASATNNETVHFNVEVSGTNQTYSVELSQQQASEVYAVFNSVKKQLSTVKNRDETSEIFSEAIHRLHSTGLLGDLNESEVLEQVLKPAMSPRLMKSINKVLVRSPDSDNSNSFCSVAGNTSNAFFCGSSIRMLNVILTLPFFIFHKLRIGTIIQKGITTLLRILAIIASPFLLPFLLILDFIIWAFDPILIQMLFHFLATLTTPFVLLIYLLVMIPTGVIDIPWILMNIYDFKDWFSSTIMIGNDRWGPSVGWVNTVGENGVVNWNGSLWGQLPLLPQVVSIPQLDQLYFYYPGILGFKGIKIWCEERQDWSYMGNAIWVNLGEHPQNPWLPNTIDL